LITTAARSAPIPFMPRSCATDARSGAPPIPATRSTTGRPIQERV
jgi:hypothetical protein